MNELVLKTTFETKIKQTISSSEVPIFKKLRDIWKNINFSAIELSLNLIKEHVAGAKIASLFMFFKAQLAKRDDHRELVVI